MTWVIHIFPIDKQGLAVSLTDEGWDGSTPVKYEVGRVAYRREESVNPDLDFITALNDMIIRADEAALVLQDADDERERLRKQDERDAKKRIRELLGNPPYDFQ